MRGVVVAAGAIDDDGLFDPARLQDEGAATDEAADSGGIRDRGQLGGDVGEALGEFIARAVEEECAQDFSGGLAVLELAAAVVEEGDEVVVGGDQIGVGVLDGGGRADGREAVAGLLQHGPKVG